MALEAQSPKSTPNWEDEVAELDQLKRQLNDYVRALHTPRPSGETAYQVISRFNTFPEVRHFPLEFDSILATTSTQLRSMRNAVDTAVRDARALGGVAEHPLQGIRVTEWRLDLADRIRHPHQQASGALYAGD